MQIDRYKEVVEHLASTNANSRFSNKGPDHAIIVVDAMLRAARKDINIFTGQLCAEFYTRNPVVNSMANFLNDPKHKLTIVSENAPDSASVEAIRNIASSGQVSFYTIDKVKWPAKSNFPSHFMTVDGKSFRLEFNDEGREAVVNFNEPAVAMALDEQFETIVSQYSSSI